MQWWYAVVWPCVLCSCKVHTNSMRMGGPQEDDQWRYVSKFGYTPGDGRYSFRLKLLQVTTEFVEPIYLPVEIFLDEDWDQVELQKPCNRSQHSRATQHVELNPWGEWGEWLNGSLQNGSLPQLTRPHMWYFALSVCNDHFLQNFTHHMRFEVHFYQYDSCHFSVEMRGVLMVHVLALFVFTVFFVKYFSICQRFVQSAESLHSVIWMLTWAMCLQYLAETLRMFHLWSYSSNGLGIKVLDILSEVFFTVSQGLLTTLMMSIGLGYTLLQATIGDKNLIISIVTMVSIFWIISWSLPVLNKDDAYYKFHENDGIVGYILFVHKILLYICFMWAIRKTGVEGGPRLRSFLRRFGAAGSLYFLAYPIFFLLNQCLAPYLRYKVMVGGLLAIQTSLHIWLARLFLLPSEYFKISTLNSSFLPENARCGLDKEE